VVRPLLHWRRAELAEIVARAGLTPASDPSNEDVAFDRVRMREALAESPWLDPLAVARSAELLQQAEHAVEGAVAAVRGRAVFWDGEVAWYYWGHPQLIEMEVVGSILEELGADVQRSEVAQMVEQLRTERHATLGGVMARRAMHRKDPLTEIDAWRFERERPRRT
jgi:tRNA(Ile)-lysidine synthase